jgi:hypothetical protein
MSRKNEMNKKISLDDRQLENADIIGSKRFQENKKHQKTMSWNLKKMTNADRDILGVQGEIAFEQWCAENDILYNSDYENTTVRSSADDKGDGVIFINRRPYSVEVKTTTAKDPHLIVPEYQLRNPKDIYILIKKTSNSNFKIMGFTTVDMLEEYYDDSCISTCNTVYRMHWSNLIQDFEDLCTLYQE